MKRFLFSIAACLACMVVQAMTVEVHGNKVFATGPVVPDDISRFEPALSTPGVDTVVLFDSPGGDLWNGMRVARLISAKGLNTIAAGYCVSACSIMFIGGKQRAFSDVRRPLATYVGIHGAHRHESKIVDPTFQPQIYAFFKMNMGERFDSAIMNMALYEMDDASALLRVYDVGRPPKRAPYHCRSGQTPRKACTTLENSDALKLGLVTTETLVQIELPSTWVSPPRIYGQELTQVLTDPAAATRALGNAQCGSAACSKIIENFLAAKEHKAIAIPVSGKGLGVGTNRETPAMAMAAAIYQCNHVRVQPVRLCEAQLANEFDLRELIGNAVTSHAEALQKTNVTADKFYGGEEYGGWVPAMKGLRTERLRDATPTRIGDITVIGTGELAALLKSGHPPPLIDVSDTSAAIPTSQKLLFGGWASDDAAQDAAFAQRFIGLLKVMGADPNAPVVFYGFSRDDWQGANAAQRAKNMGYSRVIWYRGGLASWRAAGLPVAEVVLRAVAR